MAKQRALSDEARKVQAHLDELNRTNKLTTFREVAIATLGNPNSARAVGGINMMLTDRNGGKRYPGTDLVLHKGQRIAGTTTRSQAVRMLRARGYKFAKRGEDGFVVT